MLIEDWIIINYKNYDNKNDTTYDPGHTVCVLAEASLSAKRAKVPAVTRLSKRLFHIAN